MTTTSYSESPGLKRLQELAQKKRCVLFASSYVVEEAKRNLTASEQVRNLDTFLPMVILVPNVDPNIPCPMELPDKDRPVLLSAISIKGNYLLTGDRIRFGRFFGQAVRGINPSTPRCEARGMPFDKPFGHELGAEWLKALSAAEGLRVDTEPRS